VHAGVVGAGSSRYHRASIPEGYVGFSACDKGLAMTSTLELVLIFLASAVLVVVVFRMLHLPPLLGYLLAGIVIGPHALGWIPESKEGRYLAEFGVVFLMFSIGLEFSLPKLFQMRRTVFGLGLSQVALTVAAGLAGCLAAGLGWKPGLVLGGALAMSSTAIVVRMFAERLQLDTPHGRQVVGVLLFQDLAVVPFLILIPALVQGQAESELVATLVLALGKAAIVLIVLLFLGQKLMRGWFHIIARRRSHELFILNVLLITLGLAWLTELAGLSLALGAFLAGMLIAETEYRHQVEEDIRPFREVLLGLFFVSVGMQLDLRIVRDNLALVAFLFVVPVLFKLALIAGLSRLFGGAPGTALRAGLALGQAGEFGLVIIALAAGVGVLEPELVQIVSAAMLLSMLVTPFFIQYSDKLVLRLARSEWMLRSLELHKIAVKNLATERHVIICGYGRTGQSLAHLFEREGVRYHALRTRQAGARTFVSFHVQVPGNWTVQRGHDLLEAMERKVRQTLAGVTVFTHLEPLATAVPEEAGTPEAAAGLANVSAANAPASTTTDARNPRAMLCVFED